MKAEDGRKTRGRLVKRQVRARIVTAYIELLRAGGMIGQELCNPLGLMRREVVGDDVDLSLPGFERDHLAQKRDELLQDSGRHDKNRLTRSHGSSEVQNGFSVGRPKA